MIVTKQSCFQVAQMNNPHIVTYESYQGGSRFQDLIWNLK
jgi:hypothetical protein